MNAEERLLNELKNIKSEHKFLFYAYPLEINGKKNIMVWKAGFPGLPTELYNGSYFELEIRFTEKYPLAPPHVKFLRKTYHPNVYSCGNICLDVLQHRWKPSMCIMSVLTSIQHLLQHPNLKSPANATAAKQYKNNHSAYKEKVIREIKKNHSKFPWM